MSKANEYLRIKCVTIDARKYGHDNHTDESLSGAIAKHLEPMVKWESIFVKQFINKKGKECSDNSVRVTISRVGAIYGMYKVHYMGNGYLITKLV